MIRNLILPFLCSAGFILVAHAQEVSRVPDTPRLIYLGDRIEGVVEQQIIAIDPLKGTWREAVPGLPPLTEYPPVPGQVVGYWDGFNAYREIVGFNQKRILQSGFHEVTSTGRHWFWRAPVELLEDERVLSIFNDKALTRRNSYAAGSQFKPGGAPTSAGPSKVSLALVDLIHGDRSEIFTKEIEPYDLQCAVALHMGNAFLFMNTGQIYKLAFDSQTLQSIREDFWKDSGTDLCPGPPFMDHHVFPRFRSHPFFDLDGGILLAFEGWRVELNDGAELKKKYDHQMTDRRKQELKAKGLYPFEEGKNYDIGARSAILLKFDPEAKTMREEPLDRVKGLCRENPDSKKKWLTFGESEGGELFLGPGNQILPLLPANLKRDEPVQAVPEKVKKHAIAPPKK